MKVENNNIKRVRDIAVGDVFYRNTTIGFNDQKHYYMFAHVGNSNYSLINISGSGSYDELFISQDFYKVSELISNELENGNIIHYSNLDYTFTFKIDIIN